MSGKVTSILHRHIDTMATTLQKDEESARDNHVLACIYAKYSPVKNYLDTQQSTFLNLVLSNATAF